MRIPILLIAAALTAPALAQNESDWVSYFTFQDVKFFYAPSTVQKDGAVRIVKWHDSRNPQVVFKVRIDCTARTIQSLEADEYDLLTGDYYETADLSGQPPDPLGASDSMGSALAKTVC
ncbi:hypothetical protein [Rhizomicrobium electricum]|uniref:Uncharacterized protein n=1 Tax=Rhizomicrobium electricum TaxID=480070 RepID=A0ABN1DZH6_9PROT|nr:hypothetical protein [Rhizomicrobium electricum]NIJ47247.1 hypothetical protein [Rhizomicrobium electricum]